MFSSDLKEFLLHILSKVWHVQFNNVGDSSVGNVRNQPGKSTSFCKSQIPHRCSVDINNVFILFQSSKLKINCCLFLASKFAVGTHQHVS